MRSAKTKHHLYSLAVLALTFLGCSGGGGGGGDEEAAAPPLTIQDLSAQTDGGGASTVSFGLPAGDNKLQTVAFSGSNISFTSAASSNGVNYLDPNGELLSLAVDGGPGVNALTIPSRAADPGLVSGQTFSVSTSAAGNTSVNYKILSKADPDLASGRLAVNVFYVDTYAQNEPVRQTIKKALAIFHDIYQDQAQIDVQFNEIDIAGPAQLPIPLNGSAFYASAAGLGVSPGINLFIGADIASDDGFGGTILGVAGSIGGPALPSQISAVAASLLTGAGGDGEFNDDELEVFGETFAHEVGHFMGLFHPVEIDSNRVVDHDPLGDTPTCFAYTDCVNNSDLATNLMFPFAVQNSDGSYLHQNELTNEQSGVQNRYIAVD